MNARLARSARATLLAVVLAGCSTGRARLADPVAVGRSEWLTWQAQAAQEAATSHFAVADKVLTDFIARFPSSPEAAEASYWRAFYKLDPNNGSATPHDAAVLLDGYLATGPAAVHRGEALTLRRVAGVLEARSTATPAPKPEVVKVDDKARDEELQRLKDDLAKANAELERIKRRLAQPRP